MATALGVPVPDEEHAVSVSIPTWESNVGYGNKESWVMNSLQTGYPRFCISRNVESFSAAILADEYPNGSGKACMLFPSLQCALNLIAFFHIRSITDSSICTLEILPGSNCDVHAVIYPAEHYALAKSFWQHTGTGMVSSRQCDAVRKEWTQIHRLRKSPLTPPPEDAQSLISAGNAAKATIRSRIAEFAGAGDDDVWLFPCGMSAMYHAHATLLRALGDGALRSISFGFPYCDTLKILEKFGPGALFYGHGLSSDLDDLESRLSSEEEQERYLALFCETPSNPLLRSPDLVRIVALAKQYGFAVVVDETIGNFMNVDVMKCGVDMVVTSLTKAFSGRCNVMGGSLVLNPNGRYYTRLRDALRKEGGFEDTWYPADALVMESNSRGFANRVKRMSSNASALAALLLASPKVSQVFYPQFSDTRGFYEQVRRPDRGYGFLLSFYFKDVEKQTSVFLDEIDTQKGPSLGTDFTLTSPYTILAHWAEREWAEEYGVSVFLVRVSVGAEEVEGLMERFKQALEAVPEVDVVAEDR